MGRKPGSTLSIEHIISQKQKHQEMHCERVKEKLQEAKRRYQEEIIHLQEKLPFSMSCSGQSLKIILTLKDIDKFKSYLK